MLVGEVWLPDAERFARYLRPDELHTAFNFDFLACPWEPGPMRASITLGARGARARRRAGDLGALQPRRHPPGHALRPRRHRLLVRDQARGHARPILPVVSAAPAPRLCWRWRCPGRCTSTRARSSGCRRWRTSRRTGARTRCGSAPDGVDPGRDGCRVPLPWSGSERPTGSARTLRRRCGSTSRTTGQSLSVEAETERSGVDAQPLPRPDSHPPRGAVGRRAPRSAGWTTATR